MLRIETQPVQPIALGVLKYDPNQAREAKGSAIGGQFAKAGTETYARQAEVNQLRQAMFLQAKAISPKEFLPEANLLSPKVKEVEAALSGMSEYDTRRLVKQDIHKNLVERLRKNSVFDSLDDHQLGVYVQSQLDLWAETSGDSSGPAIRLQIAVKEEFGLERAEMSHLDTAHQGYRGWAAQLAMDRAFVRAEYERTQEWFASQGITHVSVFRGMGTGENEESFDLGYTNISMQPASSWTTDLDTAADFANNYDRSVVLTTRIPVSKVLSTCVTGRGCLVEQEVIVLGDNQRVRSFSFDVDSGTMDTKRIRESLQ